MKILGYEQITNLSAAVGLQHIAAGTAVGLVAVENTGFDVRWRGDGTAPTATVGQPLYSGQSLLFDISMLRQLRFIQTAAGAALSVTYCSN